MLNDGAARLALAPTAHPRAKVAAMLAALRCKSACGPSLAALSAEREGLDKCVGVLTGENPVQWDRLWSDNRKAKDLIVYRVLCCDENNSVMLSTRVDTTTD